MEPHATDRKTKGAKQQGELKIGGRLLTDEPHPLSMSLNFDASLHQSGCDTFVPIQ